jgi:hypothetical protein
MEGTHRKVCSVVICGARLVTRVSETVVAAEVVCHALDKMSFFRTVRRLPASQRKRKSGPALVETVLKSFGQISAESIARYFVHEPLISDSFAMNSITFY